MAKAAADPKPRTKAKVQQPSVDTTTTTASEVVIPTNGHRTRTRTPMSDAHKEALALGRDEGRAIKDYLVAISMTPRRGRPVSVEGSQRKLALVQGQLQGRLNPLERLHLTQRKLDILDEIENVDVTIDIADLEERFIKAAPGYGRRKGLTWAAWRAAGVPASVLTRAGITRTNSH